MIPPRFLLALAMQDNVLRAALVLRDLRIVASAKQTFQTDAGAFDPGEVWYKMKKVVAACFDIGRTQPRELLACALLGDERAWCVWQDNAGETDSAGFFDADALAVPARFGEHDALLCAGAGRAWLLWNLSGAYVLPQDALPAWRARAAQSNLALAEPRACDAARENCFGTIRARSPFAEPLAIAAVLAETELAADGAALAADEWIQRAAARVYANIASGEK